MDRIIVSRHAAAIHWLCDHFASEGLEYVYHPDREVVIGKVRADVDAAFGQPGVVMEAIPVFTGSVNAATVDGKSVYGNLPLHLAALASEVCVIEFHLTPPRGQEYTVDDMVKAGATVRRYTVRPA